MITPELTQAETGSSRKPVNIRNLVRVAHHIDTHKIQSNRSVAAFVASFLSYRPAWVNALYHARPILMHVLGAKPESFPYQGLIRARDIEFEAGSKVWFFTVRDGQPDRRIVLRASNALLIAYMVIERTADTGGEPVFSVTTMVRYRNRIGRIYFNIIRPFHHMVVSAAMYEASGQAEEDLRRSRPRVPGFISVSESHRK